MATLPNITTANSARDSQFGWFLAIGATPEAVAVLNDQPVLFTILVIVLVSLILEGLLVWFIHFKTLKPEQKKKKGDAAKGGAAGNSIGSKLGFLSRIGGDNGRSAAGRK
jgi:hypothetical protein